MNIKIGEFTRWEYEDKIDISTNSIDKFKSIVNGLVSNIEQIDTDKILEFFRDKIDYILDISFIKEELMVEWYEILWFWGFKDLPNWEKVIEIKIAWEIKSDRLYLTKDFKILKTESWRKVFHIWKIVDVINKRTWEKAWVWTWIIIENGIWTSPVLLVYKKWIMLNTYPQINPFIGEK